MPILVSFAPSLQIRSQSPCQTKLSKKISCQVLIIRFWIKWGVVCEDLTSGCQVMPKKTFWVSLPQVYKLGPSFHITLNFPKKNCKVFIIKLWIKWGAAWDNLTSGCQVMAKKTFLAHLPQIFVLGPSSNTRSQSSWWSKFKHWKVI